ncbi:protein draper-like [Panonychus citri]|uniref:protein draper-like n=1 Tax=Panonychus citri TaxID=50023 RepID=UPI002308170E|nr:protein draper-like [Panonychus citri]
MLRIIFLTFLTINIVLALDGPNTCIEEKEVPVIVKVPAKVPQETKTFKWCISKFPPRCEVTKIVYVEGYREEIHYEKNRTRVCCKGYAEARNKCIPVCSSPCLHGRCISPEKCDCEPGWAGINCDIKHTCPKGKKGKNCDQPCLCQNDAGCDAISGECICRPGWTGVDCSEKCPRRFHGFRCLDECKCFNDGDCDPVNGRCKCKPGWKGQYCQIECSGNDDECVQGCYCDHGGYCNSTTGLCKCPPGYTGDYCSDQCPYGTYGLNCAHRCACNYSDPSSEEHVVCDHISGCKVWSSASLKILDTNESAILSGANPTSSTTLILLIGMIIIVLLISGFLILKYRRELRLLNSELAFVTYISRKESNDRFDNPLYSYQATDYKPPLSPSGQSPPLPPPQASSSSPSSASFLSTKAALLSGFKRDPELVSSSSSCKATNDKFSGLPNDFLKPFNSPTSCYEDLKTSKREYNSNIYEDGDNHCGSKFLSPSSTITPPSPTPTTTTLAKEPVYAEIPGSRSFNCSDNSDDEDLKENQYDVPRPINSPNKLDNLK